MGTMIPSSSLFLPLAALCASISVMNGLMAIWRKEPGFIVYGLAFLFAALSSALGMSPVFETTRGLAVGRLLLIGFYLFMTWGLRLMQGRKRPWPRRFSAYALLSALAMVLGGWVFRDSRWIELPNAAVSIVLCAEYIFAIKSGEVFLMPGVRASLTIVPVMFIIGNLSRLWPFVAGGEMKPAGSSVEALMANTALAVIFYMAWEGAILVLDGTRMRNELAAKNRRLETLATTDTLTGLKNRLSLDQIFRAETNRAKRYGETLSLIMLDIDHFKHVNDTWGHTVGDRALVHVANIVKLELRESDLAFRWGGEEFLVIAPHTDVAGAAVLAEKLRSLVEAARLDPVGQITISCGVASGSASEPIESWFKRADQALYRAKNEGRNRVCVWTPTTAFPAAMIRLEWQQGWESGNETVDRGHRQLLDVANSLLDLSISENEKPRLGELLERFMTMSSEHFREEEVVMDKCGYPERSQHKMLHAELLEKAQKLTAQFVSGKLGLVTLFDYLVKDFLVDHIIGDDARVIPWISPSAQTRHVAPVEPHSREKAGPTPG